jgi:hypothetical protein
MKTDAECNFAVTFGSSPAQSATGAVFDFGAVQTPFVEQAEFPGKIVLCGTSVEHGVEREEKNGQVLTDPCLS